MSSARFVIAVPGHATYYDNLALTLHKHGLLRFIAMSTRRGVAGLPSEFVRLNPAIGLATYVAARTMSPLYAESLRCRLYPWFDHWVRRQLQPGDYLISSYAYTNASFRWVRAHGGKAILDGGNSHPENFWGVLREEQRRQNSPFPPVAEHYHRRSMAMMPDVDFVMPASSFVARSFLERGFKNESMLWHSRPVNLSVFKPREGARPKDQPLTLISTGELCLRKGTPYLLETFRRVRAKVPNVRLVLRRIIRNDVKSLLAQYADLPIEWLDAMPHAELARQVRQADIFLLPSLEDGFAFTVAEALASGVPAITTPNTGASDLIQSGVNGEVVPIRDAEALTEAVLKWAEIVLQPSWQPRVLVDPALFSLEYFEQGLLGGLRQAGLIS